MNFRVKIRNNLLVLYIFYELNSFLHRFKKSMWKNFNAHKGSEAKRL